MRIVSWNVSRLWILTYSSDKLGRPTRYDFNSLHVMTLTASSQSSLYHSLRAFLLFVMIFMPSLIPTTVITPEVDRRCRRLSLRHHQGSIRTRRVIRSCLPIARKRTGTGGIQSIRRWPDRQSADEADSR